MKNKRGFFLAETIAVITVVAVVLISVFKIFSSVYLSYRQSEKYNTVSSINALANVQKYYESIEPINTTIVNESNPYVELTNYAKYNSEYYTKIKEEYNVNNVYLVDLDNIESKLDLFYMNLRKYIKTLLNKGGVVLIVVVNEDEFAYSKINKIRGKICTFDGELVQGAEFVDGQYTYRYMQDIDDSDNWTNMIGDGWGVKLTNKNSTAPVTTRLCTVINDKPIVSMRNMFHNSLATSINLSSFNTSNVMDMQGMFWNTVVTTLDLSSFDTSNVTVMTNMFWKSKVLSLDLSNFNTSKVTNMQGMFSNTELVNLDISSFDTSIVTNMYNMFWDTKLSTLDLSNFNTSNVTNMEGMFANSKMESLNLSNFNTSSVKNMKNMFNGSKATSLNLLNFVTSNVTNMESMFANTIVSTLDLSSFDTSKVTNVNGMFTNCIATTGYARIQADADKFNASSGKPSTLIFTIKD